MEPSRCPYERCQNHKRPYPKFFIRRGSYRAACRPHPIPRFQCRGCRRFFSRQTFRADYRDHKPDRNAKLIALLCSGVGLRQAARRLGLSRSSVTAKFYKIAKHITELNVNLRGQLGPTVTLQFDELETYEGRRNTRPLTLPILIERESRFHIEAVCAPIRPSGKMSDARKRAIRDEQRRFGRRPSESSKAVRRVLKVGSSMCRRAETVILQTDEKSTYPKIGRSVFGKRRLVHETTNSKLARCTWNPLFPINHTEAMARDLMGRLRRESWLVSKLGRCLDLHLQIYCAVRNFVRPRFNRDTETPAQILGFVDRRMTFGDLVSWRQDWRGESIHPCSRADRPRSVADFCRRAS